MALIQDDDNFFGLDLGASSIKIVQLKNVHGRPSLVTYGDIEIPAGLLASDSSIDQDKLAEIVKKLAQDAQVSTSNVVASLSATYSYVSIITTPKISHDELTTSIRYQADKYIPMPIEQVKIDYMVLGPATNPEEQEVLLVAAPSTLADKYLNIIQKAGLELMALEVNAIAQIRSLVPENAPTTMIADIGSIATDITIVRDKVPRLIRSVNYGGNAIVRITGQNLGLNADQAGQFVRKFGMSKDKLEGQVYKSIKPVVDGLIEEITKSLRYYQEHSQEKIEKIILTGGGSALVELPQYLANTLGIVVEIGSPWVNVSYPQELTTKLSSISLNYSNAVGLAMRGMD